MIKIRGAKSYREYCHAEAFAQLIRDSFPGLDDNEQQHVHLFTPIRPYGQRVKDLDIVAMGTFPEPLIFRPAGRDPIAIHAFCSILEVKNTPYIEFRQDVGEVVVDRDGVPEFAIGQCEQQKEALRNWLRDEHGLTPFVTNFLWLRQKLSADIPPDFGNVLGADITFGDFLSRLTFVNRPLRHGDGSLHLQRPDKPTIKRALEVVNSVPPQSNLDRQRIDRLTNENLRKEEWHPLVGSTQVLLRGRGGAGKTFALLERALAISRHREQRVAILTYNHALVSDIERQLLILRDEGVEHHVSVHNVHRFLLAFLRRWDFRVLGNGEFTREYKTLLANFLREVRLGEIALQSIRETASELPEFSFSHVFIDEGQDWLDEERDVLHKMYESSTFVVAVGTDQLVRQSTPCDWTAKGTIPSHAQSMQTCLRMASHLAMFVNQFANECEVLSWKAREEVRATGGTVTIIEGDYFSNRKYHDAIVAMNNVGDNQPIDMLMCLPPRIPTSKGRINAHDVPERLIDWGYQVWDGTDLHERKLIPWDTEQIRLVQYASSRGLEGWTVVNIAMDEFYDFKVDNWQDDAEPRIAFPELELDEYAQRLAARWCIIPLTRSIAHLVINVRSKTTALGRILYELYKNSEGVNWVALDPGTFDASAVP